MRLQLVGTAVAALVLGSSSAAVADDASANLDALYRDRDAKGAQNGAAVDAAVKAAPDDYEVLWRAARWHCWLAGGVTGEKRRSEAETCWDLGKKAVSLKPGRVEGNYFCASGSGQYASEIGILKAIGMGMEGVFNGYIDKALEADATFESGGPYLIKGRYWHELPFIKRSYSKSAALLRKALEVQPQNVRAQIYLAETLVDDGDAEAAKVLIDQAAAHKVGAYDAPEERRALMLLGKVKAKIDEKLK